jgi:hypothetical protein
MKKLVFSILLIGIFISTNAQSNLFVTHFEVIGLHESYKESVSNVFIGYLLKNNKYKLTFKDDLNIDFSINDLQQKAKAENCEYFIKSNLNALGELIIVSVSLYETENLNLIWSDILKAKTIEDIDPILYRFSKIIGTEFTANDESDIYDVSEYESDELKRYEANSNIGIFIGGAYTFMQDVEQNASEGFGLILSYDTRDYLLEAKGELFFSDINHYSFSIDILNPIYIKRNTPFYGFGLSFGGTSVDFKEKYTYNYYADYDVVSYSKGGLILEAHAGYIFNRNSNVNLRLNVSPFLSLYEVKDKTPYGVKFYVSLFFD